MAFSASASIVSSAVRKWLSESIRTRLNAFRISAIVSSWTVPP
jgi:hypothetical protein